MAPVTFGAMANVATQNALNSGISQANSQGLGETEANALAITNLMEDDEQGGLVNKLMSGSTKKKGSSNIGVGTQAQQQSLQLNKDILGGVFSTTV